MTAISKYPEPNVIIEPSTTTTTPTALNENSSNSSKNIIVDDTSKRKWRYCPSDDGNGDGGEGEDDNGENEANCSGYDDELVRISSPVPTFSNIPWSRSRKYLADLEGLHYELLECFDWLRPTEAERFARCNVCQRVRNVLIDITPDAIFYVFGSVATNLFLPTSDIDISVELQRLSPYDMQIVADAFRNSKNFKDVNVLDRVHVPIIKLTDRETNINIDISFNTSKAHCAVEYILYMRSWFPAIELFVLILKQFLASRQLNQAFTGGLSSYGLILMIVHYMLRFYRSFFFVTDIHQLPIGMLSKFFMDFLEYYGRIFDPLTEALAFPKLDEAVLMSKSHLTSIMNENFFASVLCIQDPLTPMNDVGRGAHNFLQVKAAFNSAFTNLNKKIKYSKSGEPMLQSIMTFPQSFVQFRRRINCLPFENILEHIGNEPYIFGGQPAQPFSYDCDAREAILFPATINASPQIFFPQSMHQQQNNQQQQQQSSTFDENGILIEQLSTSSSEASSSATPTAFPSPHAAADNNISISRGENEFYTNIQQPQMQQQQIFFPPPPPQIFHHQNQRPEMFSFNPYFAMSFPQHLQHQIPPPHAYHHQHFINSNDYANSNNNNKQQHQEYAYSESYYNDNEEEEQQQQLEDDFGKILSLDDEETKANNGNTSDASSDSSGLSSGSGDSMISCSTVTPESYDEQIAITTATEGEEESSSNGGNCCNKNGRS
jgi:DNA polymerase sigma